jgi:hypothetical protein
MTPSIQVGTLATAKRDSAICAVGEMGVCYEVYTIGNRPGYSFIFEKGGYDGFSLGDVELFLEVTDVVFLSIANYTFENVTQLERDFHNGRFSGAFSLLKVDAQQIP